MATFTNNQRSKRESAVSEMIERGLSVTEIAKALGVSKQAVSKFIRLRGWEIKAKHGSNQTSPPINTAVDNGEAGGHKPNTETEVAR